MFTPSGATNALINQKFRLRAFHVDDKIGNFLGGVPMSREIGTLLPMARCGRNSTPILHLRARVVKAHEPIGVQALGPELAIETLDGAVVGRLAGSGEVERHALVVGPQFEVARDELAAVVDTDECWIWPKRSRYQKDASERSCFGNEQIGTEPASTDSVNRPSTTEADVARSPDRSGATCPATFAGAEVGGHAVLRQYLSLRGRATRSVERCDMHNLPKSFHDQADDIFEDCP